METSVYSAMALGLHPAVRGTHEQEAMRGHPGSQVPRGVMEHGPRGTSQDASGSLKHEGLTRMG